AGDVTLDDELELVDLALAHVLEELFKAAPATGPGHLGGTLAGRPLLGDLPRHTIVGDHDEVVTGARHRRQTHHQHRPGGVGLGDGHAVVVEHRPDSAVGLAADDGVADPQRASLDEHGRDRTTPLVEVGLDGDALRV